MVNSDGMVAEFPPPDLIASRDSVTGAFAMISRCNSCPFLKHYAPKGGNFPRQISQAITNQELSFTDA
jgi:hypothetical protein